MPGPIVQYSQLAGSRLSQFKAETQSSIKTFLPFDPQRAQALLEGEGGFDSVSASDLEICFVHNTSEGHKAIAQFIQSNWKEHLGIEVELAVV